jgi:hypothetical protein
MAIAGDSLDERTLVVGEVVGGGFSASRSAAYVFTWDGATWIQQAKLTASDSVFSEFFEQSVAVDGDTVVLGARDANGFAAAYTFERPAKGWRNATEDAKLATSDGASFGDSGFVGDSVAIDGDTVFLGAQDPNDFGAVYVFNRPAGGWAAADIDNDTTNGILVQETAKLTASDGAAGDVFGGSVAVDGNTVVIGASDGDTEVSSAGAA